MKFKVGDKVRVRTDLKIDKMYGGWFYVAEMDKLKDRAITIKKCYIDSYLIEEDEDSYNWSDEMLVKEEFTFQEVIARIKPNETYESVRISNKLRNIHMYEDGILKMNYKQIIDDTIFIHTNQTFRLKEAKKSFTIYYIEHKPNEKQYKFRSNERLNINDFVICDTKFGKTYGKVCSYEEVMLTEKESEQYKKCWKA